MHRHRDSHHGADQPPHVAHPEQAVGGLEVHDDTDIEQHLGGEPDMGMHRAFRPPGRAGRVHQHQRRVGVERQGGETGVLIRYQRVEPMVASLAPGNVHAHVAHHDHVAQRGRRRGRLIGHRLHRHEAAAARGAVGGDQRDRLRIDQPIGDGARTEAREHRQRYGAALGTGEIGGDRRQEQPDHVARPQAERVKPSCEPAHAVVEHGVGPAGHRARLVLRHDHLARPERAAAMPVERVEHEVRLAAHAPAREGHPARNV